jgi:hypothetical protein
MCRARGPLVYAAVVTFSVSVAHAAPIGITAVGVPYAEAFDTLGATGTANAFLPEGWALAESGTSPRVNGAYASSTGSDATGDVYSYGSAASVERAFGTLRSGTLNPIIGAAFVNRTGGTLTALDISYTGEQWRVGVVSRGTADRLDFQYSLDAAGLTTGTWVDVDALDFNSPNVNSSAGALDGNAAANRSSVAYTLTGLGIADGATFWIRWLDFDIPGFDDGLAVDDFSLTARGALLVSEPDAIALLGLCLAAVVASRRRRGEMRSPVAV